MSAPDTRIQRPVPAPVFSVPKYLDRIEKASDEILEQRENSEKYVCILWWGLDGLRMNEDGSLEWVSKRKKTADIPIATVASGVSLRMELLRNISSCTCGIENNINSLTRQIESQIQNQMNSLILQEQQTMANQMLCNMITPVPTPGYLSGRK